MMPLLLKHYMIKALMSLKNSLPKNYLTKNDLTKK